MSTFVSVGNTHQHFTRLLDAVAVIALELPQPVIVQHGHTTFSHPCCRSEAFLEMSRFERCIASADLVIMHAGAGGLIHALLAGKTPVIFPRRAEYREHLDNHQVQLARAFAEAGRAVLAHDANSLLNASRDALARQSQQLTRHRVPHMIALVHEVLCKLQ
jgi:UDP-N-acetylglucosamine transferase subunit ALG13